MNINHCLPKIVAGVAISISLLLILGEPVIVLAADAPLRLAGSAWFAGSGSPICAPSTNTTCAGQTHVGGISSNWWQCVEGAQRFYNNKGWHSGTFGVSIANDIYWNATSIGLVAHGNGSGYTPVPGDLIVHKTTQPFSGGAGHVSVVDSISSNTIYAVEQNGNASGRTTYTLSGTTISQGSYGTQYIEGIVHDNANTNTNPNPLPTPTPTPTPPEIPWNFENLDGDSGSIGGHNSDNGWTPFAIEFGSVLHTFYVDRGSGDLRHAYADSGGWHFEVLDGAGGSNGRISADVGYRPSAVIYSGTLQLYYYDNTNHGLRHAFTSDGTNWTLETLDGTNSTISGHSSADVGYTSTAMVDNSGVLQLFYYDATNGNLRHAWANSSGWHFENLDGDSGSIAGFSANLGKEPTAVVFSSNTHLFYYDVTNGNLRHAYENSSGWHFENLDGDSGSIGGLNSDVGQSPEAIVYNSTQQLFYYDATSGNLRHAFEDSSGWHFENLEGEPLSVSGYDSNLGLYSTATVLGSTLQLFYYETSGGNIRHAYADSSGWHFENLDGEGGLPTGRMNADEGLEPKAITYNSHVQLYYYDNTYGNFRHSWSQ